eukprot:Opistho-2@49829
MDGSIPCNPVNVTALMEGARPQTPNIMRRTSGSAASGASSASTSVGGAIASVRAALKFEKGAQIPIVGPCKSLRILHLTDDGNHFKTQHVRVEQGDVLRFVLSPLLQSKNVRVFTNYPHDGKEFVRAKFHEIKWRTAHTPCAPFMFGERAADVGTTLAGAFDYYFTWCDDPDLAPSAEHPGAHPKHGAYGHFLVDPVLSINGTYLPMYSALI